MIDNRDLDKLGNFINKMSNIGDNESCEMNNIFRKWEKYIEDLEKDNK